MDTTNNLEQVAAPDVGELDDLALLLSEITDVDVERHVSAGPFCTYRVGGPINILVRVETPVGLAELARVLARKKSAGVSIPTLPLGKGSNLLVSEKGFAGVGILLLGEFSAIAVDGKFVTAGAAAPLPLVARASVRNGLTGFEWAVGVPGTIGGGVRMNAGGHGSDMAANLVSVVVVDLETGELDARPASDLGLGYRTSSIEPHHVVTSATLALAEVVDPEPNSADLTTGEEALSEIVRWRRANQPGGQNAGSVFTNPADDSAGRLIDAAGMKGHRIGTAEVSTVHANFIQVDPGGSADDVMALMREIVATVFSASGVRLHAETRLVGFADADVDDVQSSKS